MSLPDLMLVDRCLEGDAAAARELFRTHHGRVRAVLYRVFGGRAELDDLVQEAFLQVFRSLRGFRGEARLSTWIDRVAVRVAYRAIAARKGRAPEVDVDDHELAGGIDPAAQAIAREGLRRFYAALAQLGPASRVAFALFAVDGRSIAETAEAMGASVTATKLRIWRARRGIVARAADDPFLAEFLGGVSLEEEP
jgi:RNA polymerase sigma-70 factor (ECF subfamily)